MSETRKSYEVHRNVSWVMAVLGIAFSVFMWSITGPSMFTTNLIMSFIMAVPVIGLAVIGWAHHKMAETFEK